MRKYLINPFTKVFPASYLLLLLPILEERGINTTTLLQKINLPELNEKNPEQFVSLQFAKTFFEKILEQTNIPELGVCYGQQLNFATHGDIGNAIITSQNLKEGLETVMKYFKTRTPIADIHYEKRKATCVISARFNLVSEIIDNFLVEAFFATTLSVRKFILTNHNYEISIFLKRPEPENPQPFFDFFGQNVFFNSKNNEYHFPSESLLLTFPLSNPIARSIAEKKCQQKLKELEHLDDLVSKVKSLMLATPSYFPNLEMLSQKLFMSPRTLRRKLSDLNTSYQFILDDVRKELAINYLENSELSIIEIAQMLQFSDSSNFSSAFRRWTNQSPSDYRQSL